MYIKIQKSGKGGNTGSCQNYADYLEKEDNLKEVAGEQKEYFFSHEKNQVEKYEVINGIDGNTKKLGKKDAKFFSLTISPSKKELRHIGNDSEKLKNYTREVMNKYAENFKREGVSDGKDIVYYAKIEHYRTYKGTDKGVRLGEVKQGEVKPGEQTHIHVIVSRKDKQNRIKLSPLANEKGNNKSVLNGKRVQRGFNRSEFKTSCEKVFDEKFSYERDIKETFIYANKVKKASVKEKMEIMTVETKELVLEKTKEINIEKIKDKGLGL